MKNLGIFLFLICFGVLLSSDENVKVEKNIYAGVNRCQVCHETKEMGDQFGIWLNSKHAKAYETLLSEDAAQIAKERGLSKPANESPECLPCHVTGYNDPLAEYGETYNKTMGVGCESCHGAGEKYRKEEIMCDIELAKAKGLIMPTPDACLSCHNEKSPRYKPFDYETYFAKIVHKINPDFKCPSPEDEDDDGWD